VVGTRQFLEAVEEVRRVEVLEVPAREDVRVGVVDVLDKGLEHGLLLLEAPDFVVDRALDGVVAVDFGGGSRRRRLGPRRAT